jgi:hypothetical protein
MSISWSVATKPSIPVAQIRWKNEFMNITIPEPAPDTQGDAAR